MFSDQESKYFFFLWFGLFLALPAKGVLSIVFELMVLCTLLYHWRGVIDAVNRHKCIMYWLISWSGSFFILGVIQSSLRSNIDQLFLDLLQYIFRIFVMATFALLSLESRKASSVTVARALLFAMLIHAGSMFWQWYSGWDITHRIFAEGRLSGSVFNPNPFGLFMAIGFVCAISLASIRNASERNFYMMAALIFAVCVWKSGSRSAVVALLASCIMLLTYISWRKSVRVAVIFSLTSVSIWLVTYLTTAGERAYSDAIRINAIQESFKLISEYPLLGIGWDYTASIRLTPDAIGAHNIFLDLALALGVPALILFGLSQLYFFYATRRATTNMSNFFRAAIILILAAGMFDYSLISSKVYVSLFVLVSTLLWVTKRIEAYPHRNSNLTQTSSV